MGIAIGVLAGLLVVTFDFSAQENTLFVILTAVVLIDIVLLGLVYKKGKLGKRNLQFP